MADYIDREKLLAKIDEAFFETDPDGEVQIGFLKCRAIIREIPAADVAPVVHSYWEEYSCSQYMGTDGWGEPKWRDGRFYVCHNYKCRRKTVIKSNYCPNCGARMDGYTNKEGDNG